MKPDFSKLNPTNNPNVNITRLEAIDDEATFTIEETASIIGNGCSAADIKRDVDCHRIQTEYSGDLNRYITGAEIKRIALNPLVELATLNDEDEIGADRMTRILGVNSARVKFYIHSGRLKATKKGGRWIILGAEAKRFAALPRGTNIKPQGDQYIIDESKRLRAEGKSDNEIAEILNVHIHTITYHKRFTR